MTQLFLDQFRIDTQRCQITHGDVTLTLEPKVMKVFQCLAKHQGEVVSHQTLLDEIWGNSVVDPSALQRCIAQLRKAFQDDARQQRVIATYPKNGYSLLLPVTTRRHAVLRRLYKPFLAAGIALALLVISGLLYLRPNMETSLAGQQTAPSSQANLPLDNSDFFVVYSPDGLRMVYPRQHEDGGQQLWVRDLTNGEELRLTEAKATYAEPAWSQDSQHLAVLSTKQNATCSNLLLLDIPATLARREFSQTATDTLIECHQELYSPQWLSKTELVYIDNSGADSRILRIDLSQHREINTFYNNYAGQLRHLSYSGQAGRLAVSSLNQDGQAQLILLSVDATGNTSDSKLTINLPDSLLETGDNWRPIWNPQANGLIIAAGSTVYHVSLEGQVTQQRSPFLPESLTRN